MKTISFDRIVDSYGKNLKSPKKYTTFIPCDYAGIFWSFLWLSDEGRSDVPAHKLQRVILW